MPNRIPFVQTRLQAPTVTGFGFASWGGNSLQPPTVVPELADAAIRVSGKGIFLLGSKISGRQGMLDALIYGGPDGETGSIIALISATSVTIVELGIVDRVVTASLQDVEGNVVGSVQTISLDSVESGRPTRVQLAWSAIRPIGSGLYMKILVNGKVAPVGDYSILPTAPWNYLRPTKLFLGSTAFDGEVRACQISSNLSGLDGVTAVVDNSLKIVSIVCSGSSTDVTFNRDVGIEDTVDSAPFREQFTFSLRDAEVEFLPSSASITGAVLTLGHSFDIKRYWNVGLTYVKGGDTDFHLKDDADVFVANFSNRLVDTSGAPVDLVTPLLSDAAINEAGTLLTFLCSKYLKLVTPSSDVVFTLNGTAATASVTPVQVENGEGCLVSVPLQGVALQGETITVSFTQNYPALQDLAGNLVPNFVDMAVTNNSEVTALTVQGAFGASDVLYVVFEKEINHEAYSDIESWALDGGSGATILGYGEPPSANIILIVTDGNPTGDDLSYTRIGAPITAVDETTLANFTGVEVQPD